MRALAIALVLMGCAPALDVGATQGAIIGGHADTGDDAVVAIVRWDAACDAEAIVMCTGVLIAPRVVLTAGHCADDVVHAQSAVFFGSDVAGAGTYVPIARAVAHPDFDRVSLANDLGVLVLASAASVTPVSVPTATSIADLPVGSSLRIVGFGITDAADLPFATAGVKREGTMTLRSVDITDFVSAPAPENTCRVDSGGPVLGTVGGTEWLLGITSSGDAPCVDRSHNMRVDAARAWIQQRIDEVQASPPRPTPDAPRLAALCTAACTTDDDCPLSMSCDLIGDGMHCTLRNTLPGSFGPTCDTDRDCVDAMCTRLEATGPTACRCLTLCGGPMTPPDAGPTPDAAHVTTPPPSGGSCGCAAAGTRASAWWLAAGSLLVLLRRRRSGL